MAYDIDGSMGFWYNDEGDPTNILTNANMNVWNNESTDEWTDFGATNRWVGIIFPELRDISGFMVVCNGLAATFQTSSDTTNGGDGTWITRMNSFTAVPDLTPKSDFRTNINGLSVTGVKAVRYRTDENQRGFHLYGTPSVGENPDRLIIWEPVADAELADNALDPGDGGDVTQGQVYDRTFRVKNNSATLTATNVDVSVEVLTDNTPSVGAMYTVSYDGGPFNPVTTIPSIAPGAISNVVTMRFNVSGSAQNEVCALRVNAIPQTYA